MSYLVIARKWRPQSFEDLVGQETIAKLLINSIRHEKVAHAYIFSGPRGVGKTSTARILAKALNCEKGPTITPCDSCPSCTSIAGGTSIDILEIDGASNRGIDEIRELREQVKYAPSEGRYKVYIIDEAHMLTPEAFNALLKTLEEPPPYVVFVLATTSPHKIPLTVQSRCQHLPFRKIPAQKIKERLKTISSAEGINISQSALDILARAGDGSMRDSLTILDQIATSLTEINESDIKDLLGVADLTALMNITEAVIKGNREKIIELISELVDRGADLRAFTKDLTKFLRDLLILTLIDKPDEILDMSKEEISSLKKRFSDTSPETLILMLGEMIKADSNVKTAFYPRVGLEMALLKLSYLSSLKPIKEILKALSNETPEKHISSPQIDVTPPQKETSLHTSESFLKELIDKVSNPLISATLSKATLRLEGSSVIFIFEDSDAEILSESLKRNLTHIRKIACEILNAPIDIKINISTPKTEKKNLMEEIISEPAVKEALELFDGRIIDIIEKKLEQ